MIQASDVNHFPPGTTLQDICEAISPRTIVENRCYPPSTTIQDLAQHTVDGKNLLELAITSGVLPYNTTKQQLETTYVGDQTAWQLCQKHPFHHTALLQQFPPSAYDLPTQQANLNSNQLLSTKVDWLLSDNPTATKLLAIPTLKSPTALHLVILQGKLPPGTTKAELQEITTDTATNETAWDLCKKSPEENYKLLSQYPPSDYKPATISAIVKQLSENMAATINWLDNTPNKFAQLPNSRAYTDAPKQGHYPPGSSLDLLWHLGNEQFNPANTAAKTGYYPPNTTIAELAKYPTVLKTAIHYGTLPPDTTKEQLQAITIDNKTAWQHCLETPKANAHFLVKFPAANFNPQTAHTIAQNVAANNPTQFVQLTNWLTECMQHHSPIQPTQQH